LNTVPHFDNVLTVEAEQMYGLPTGFSRKQLDVGVDGYQIAITERVLDRELLAGELFVVFDHRLLQCWKTCGKESVDDRLRRLGA
jgi:hypothetical protein